MSVQSFRKLNLIANDLAKRREEFVAFRRIGSQLVAQHDETYLVRG
jgi:hypothetical protein